MIYYKLLKRRFSAHMKPSFFFFFLITLQFSFGQNYTTVDRKVDSYPSYSNTTHISNRIEKDFKTDIDKVRAAYVWVAKNIKYDLKEFYSGAKQISFRYSSKEELQMKIKKRNEFLINKTLKTRKAVCEGYSQTFKKICDLLQIKCEVISGYTKTFATEIGQLPLGGRHAWNAVYINGQWKLIDTTWAAGYSNNHKWAQQFDDYFFFTSPEDFINSHFPENTKWQLTKVNYSQKQFADFPILTPYYFKNRLQLRFPRTGKLRVGNKNYLAIRFHKKNISEDFAYAYENDIYMSTVIPELIKGETVLKIPISKKKNLALNIIVNGNVVLQYQIK